MALWTYTDYAPEPVPPPRPPHAGLPPHVILGEGIAHVSGQVEELHRLVDALRSEFNETRRLLADCAKTHPQT